MTQQQIFQTIGLDLKRVGQYLYLGFPQKARYYFDEANNLLAENQFPENLSKPLTIANMTDESLDKTRAEDFLTAGSIIFSRAKTTS